jgi:TPR repeat protein
LPSSYISPRLEQPKGVKQDDLKALKFFQKACGLNDGSGCSQLGVMYEKGKGVKQDDFKALKYISPRLKQPTPEFKSHAFW